MVEPFRLSPIADLTLLIGDDMVSAIALGVDRVFYLVTMGRASFDPDDGHTPNGFTSEVSPRRYRIIGWTAADVVLDVVLDDVPLLVSHVDSLDGDLLLAGGRSDRPAERNARVYSRDGRFVRAMTLGDGTQDVQCTEDGTIWAAYFDEGIFGDDPTGGSGLVAFDAAGNPQYTFKSTERGYSIGDSDALNVVGNGDVWLVNSPNDYTLLHLRWHGIAQTSDPFVQGATCAMQRWASAPDACRTVLHSMWNLPVFDTACFAVSGRYAMFSCLDSPAGKGATHEINLYSLYQDRRFEAIGRFTPSDAAGKPIEVQRYVGRGDAIYLLADCALYRIDVETALAACGKSK